MDSKKIGQFLKELRKEKSLTQEQLAEKFNISSRTVSRWETGTNIPDLSILVEIADFYDVDIREIINGERKSDMENEMKETLKKAAEYAEYGNIQLKKRIIGLSSGALVLLVFCTILQLTDGLGGLIAEQSYGNIMGFTLGLTMALLFMNILYLNGKLDTINNWKRRIFHKK